MNNAVRNVKQCLLDLFFKKFSKSYFGRFFCFCFFCFCCRVGKIVVVYIQPYLCREWVKFGCLLAEKGKGINERRNREGVQVNMVVITQIKIENKFLATIIAETYYLRGNG